VNLVVAESREPVLIAMGQQLTAGSVLFQTLTGSVTPDGGNSGNGTATIQSVGLDAVIGDYAAVCISSRANRGSFELRNADGRVIDRINVGTPFKSSVVNLTIADGSDDFEVGDSFAIAVAGSSTFKGYDFTADSTPPQVATAVLAADVDTTAGALEQFATASGPAILSSTFVHIARWTAALNQSGVGADAYDDVVDAYVNQLARRGIVIRGTPFHATANQFEA
jgi:hypothetical protein